VAEIYDERDMVCSLGMGNATAHVYRGGPGEFRTRLEFHGEPLRGLDDVRKALHEGRRADVGRAWEAMKASSPFHMTERDVADIMILTARTNSLMKGLEAGMTATEWYEKEQHARAQEKGFGIER